MNIILFANNAASAIASAISNSATSATLSAGTGTLFPDPGEGQFFAMTFYNPAVGPATGEVVYVTGVTGDTVTIVRGQEGTAAQAWPASTVAANLLTAGVTEDLTMLPYAVAAGGPNAWTAAIEGLSGLYAPVDGTTIYVSFDAVNTGAAPTLDLNTSTALVIYYPDGVTTLESAALPARAILQYDAAIPGWVCLNAAAPSPYAVAGGSVNAWTAALAGVPATLADGYSLRVQFPETNTTNSATFDLDAMGAEGLYYSDGVTPLPIGWLPLNAILQWGATVGGWIVLNAIPTGQWSEIASYTVTGDTTATITFTDIPQVFNELLITGDLCNTATDHDLQVIMALSNDNGSTYPTQAQSEVAVLNNSYAHIAINIPGYAFSTSEIGVKFPVVFGGGTTAPGSFNADPAGIGAVGYFTPFSSNGVNAIQLSIFDPESSGGPYYFVAPSFTASIAATTMTVTAILQPVGGTPIVEVNQVTGVGVAAGTFFTGSGSGGGTGTYPVNISQTTPSTTITMPAIIRLFGR